MSPIKTAALALCLAALLPAPAIAADNGNWLAVLKTIKGPSRCATEYRISFMVDDGKMPGETRADGIAWLIKGNIRDNGKIKGRATGTVIGAPTNRFFASLSGTIEARAGTGKWKTTGGCSGTMKLSKAR